MTTRGRGSHTAEMLGLRALSLWGIDHGSGGEQVNRR